MPSRAPFALIEEGQAAGAVVAGDPRRLGMVVFAASHGLAALVNSGILDDAALAMLAALVERLVLGLWPR